jgi:hypothetical protein
MPHDRLAPHLGRFAVRAGILPGPDPLPDRFVVPAGNGHWTELARAQPPGSLERSPAIRLAPVARLLGKARWSHYPTEEGFLRPGAVQPLATRPRCVPHGQFLALGLQLPNERVDIALARTARAPAHDLCLALLGHRGDREALLMDSQPHEKCASLCQG